MQLLCGDCLELLKDIPDNSIDLVVTDPPYEIDSSQGGGLFKQKNGVATYLHRLEFIKDGFDKRILDELCRIMKRINIYIFCSKRQILPLLKFFVEKKGCGWNSIDWIKTNPPPLCGNTYLSDKEYVLFFREQGVKLHGTFESKRTWFMSTVNKQQKDNALYGHPTTKPIELIERLCFNSSTENDTVLDCFMGSGTTGVACVNLNRNFIGMEIDEHYFEVAKKRIEDAQKEKEQSLFKELAV